MAGCSRSDPTGLAQMWLTLALSILQIIPTQLDKAEAQTPGITTKYGQFVFILGKKTKGVSGGT